MITTSHILITGGSGFLGDVIVQHLLHNGHKVTVLDLVPPKVEREGVVFVQHNMAVEQLPEDILKTVDAVINLAGAPIFGRWNSQKKKIIRDSRVIGTRNLVKAMSVSPRTKVLISASAVGYYGDRGDETVSVASSKGVGFLASVAAEWESAAREAEQYHKRVHVIRNGHILGRTGGLVPVLLPFYKWGIGGPLGSGKQFFPWIYIDDCAALYVQAVEDTAMNEVTNAASGTPITNKEFSQAFAKAVKRPHIFHIPVFVLRILYGGFAQEIVSSQKVISTLHNVQYRTIAKCLEDIVRVKNKA